MPDRVAAGRRLGYIAVMLGAILFLATVAGVRAADGQVHVTTDPPGAEVLMDGTAVGPAPQIVTVRPGRHTVVARKPGYEEVVVRAESREDLVTEVRIPLPPIVATPAGSPGSAGSGAAAASSPGATGTGQGTAPSELELTAPSGAEIRVDGAPVLDDQRKPAKVPVTIPGLSAGVHRLLLTSAGAPPIEIDVTLPAGGRWVVDDAFLAKAPRRAPAPAVPADGAPGAPPAPPTGTPPSPAAIPPYEDPRPSGVSPQWPAPVVPQSAPSRPEPPRAVRVTLLEGGRVKLEWDSPPGATGFHVYRSDAPDAPFLRVNPDAPVPVTTLLLPARESGSRPLYRVTSLNASGAESEPSTSVSP